MKKALIFPIIFLLFASCKNYDDFEFTGTVVDYEMCNGLSDLGYAINLESPDTIGGTYKTRDSVIYNNVIIVYGADRLLKSQSHISGRIYMDHNYSKTQ